ncbi:hypothetical protein C8J56DRAFT_884506 [Mycena floridula]|nr:hypothetical protein C8J56DRAFT_884506 [Mycena floridula]
MLEGGCGEVLPPENGHFGLFYLNFLAFFGYAKIQALICLIPEGPLAECPGPVVEQKLSEFLSSGWITAKSGAAHLWICGDFGRLFSKVWLKKLLGIRTSISVPSFMEIREVLAKLFGDYWRTKDSNIFALISDGFLFCQSEGRTLPLVAQRLGQIVGTGERLCEADFMLVANFRPGEASLIRSLVTVKRSTVHFTARCTRDAKNSPKLTVQRVRISGLEGVSVTIIQPTTKVNLLLWMRVTTFRLKLADHMSQNTDVTVYQHPYAAAPRAQQIFGMNAAFVASVICIHMDTEEYMHLLASHPDHVLGFHLDSSCVALISLCSVLYWVASISFFAAALFVLVVLEVVAAVFLGLAVEGVLGVLAVEDLPVPGTRATSSSNSDLGGMTWRGHWFQITCSC